MNLDLEQIKTAARAAGGQPWSVDGYIVCEDLPSGSEVIGRVEIANMLSSEAADFIEAANPAVVLALVERLERAERISPYAFWFTGVDEFDDLCPAEVLAGACLAQRMDAPTPAQRRTLELPPLDRCNKIKAYAASTGPDVIS
ncbi:hypothetical protein [Cupriavidus sp. DL-D2]|uniref:hypothetical protein n=1 Tax=Cupriavidus sp. DL-D2 TaxID=3144974 RepID=UPI00321537D1